MPWRRISWTTAVGQAVAAEAADGQVVAVVDEAGDGVGDGRQLVGQGARLGGEGGAGAVGGRVGEERAVALGEDVMGQVQSAVGVPRNGHRRSSLGTLHLTVSGSRTRAAVGGSAGRGGWSRGRGPRACSGSRGSPARRPGAAS